MLNRIARAFVGTTAQPNLQQLLYLSWIWAAVLHAFMKVLTNAEALKGGIWWKPLLMVCMKILVARRRGAHINGHLFFHISAVLVIMVWVELEARWGRRMLTMDRCRAPCKKWAHMGSIWPLNNCWKIVNPKGCRRPKASPLFCKSKS